MTTENLGGVIPPGFTAEPKTNEDGQQLYLLPQPDLEITYMVPKTIKTTDVTDDPVMIYVLIPIMDGETQKEYEVTRPVYDQNGDIIGQEGTGQFLKMWSPQSQQEKDDENELLYWTVVEEEAVRYERQASLEITNEDSLYVEGLEMAYDLVPIPPEPYIPPQPTLQQQIAKLEIENAQIKSRLVITEQGAADNSMTTQQLLELLIDMEVI